MQRHITSLFIAILTATAPVSGAQAPAVPQDNVPPAAIPENAASRDSDPYAFSAADSVAEVISLSRAPDGVRFVWPRDARPWDTALLAVRSWGAEQDPWVEVSVGGLRIQQYLDANAVGVRWLNLSGLRERVASQLSLVRTSLDALLVERPRRRILRQAAAAGED